MASKISILLCCLPLLVDHSFATNGDCHKSPTVESFIELVQEFEGATPGHRSSEDILNHLLRLVDDTSNLNPKHPRIEQGDKLRQMLNHKVSMEKDGTIEQGVLSDGEEAIVIGNVLAHLFPNNKIPEELGFHSLGEILAYATMKSKVVRSVKEKVGPKGRWDSGCPAKYSIASKGSAVTRAQILGSIDGLIMQARQRNEDVKLSTALRSYYFGRTPVGMRRADIFCQKETVSSLRADIVHGCEKMTKASFLGTNGLPVRFATIKNCEEVAEDALQGLQALLDLKNACSSSKDPKLAMMTKEKSVLDDQSTLGQSDNERVGGGSIKSAGCKLLASGGDCSFYQCVEDEYRDCGDEGLALGYALPTCSRFDQFLDEFTPQGQEWIRASRTCLMTGILPHYKTVHFHHRCQTGACSSLMETFLQLMPECYLDTEPGLCEVLQDDGNWQALMKVFEVDGFDEGHFVFMFQQVEDAMQSCLCHNKEAWLAIKDHMKDKPNFLLQFLQTRNVEAQSEISEECEAYASAGDCRFYECMEERFPCKVKFYSSHFADFELPSCTEFVRNAELLADDGQVWLNSSHSCLMEALLPLYNSDSINCAEMHSRMFDLRINCFINSQFCGIMLDNDWALHESTLTNGFPKYIPNFARPLTFGYDLDRLAFYYRNLLAFQRLLRDINCECFNRGLSANKYWFSTVYSTQCDCMLRIKN